MKNFVQGGSAVEVTAPANVVSGQALLVGSLFGVCATDAASGKPVVMNLVGAYTLPKVTGAVEVGEALYWDDGVGVKKLTVTPGANLVGVALKAALSGDATVLVRLNGGMPVLIPAEANVAAFVPITGEEDPTEDEFNALGGKLNDVLDILIAHGLMAPPA